MIGVQGRVPVFAYRRPTDLRKGFEGLSALVREALVQDPLSGALYLFTNRRRTTAKVSASTPNILSLIRGAEVGGRRCGCPPSLPRIFYATIARNPVIAIRLAATCDMPKSSFK